MKSLMKGLAIAVVAAGVAFSASAQTKINLGYTAVSDFASAFVAKEEGYFAKNGLDVELTLIGLNSTIPAAVMAGSLQVGGPTPSVMLQAVDGGLDLVAIGEAAVTAKSTASAVAVVANPKANIKGPKDFVGKKVGAPGLGAFLHVLFRQWLIVNGVDPKQVTFIEVGFPTQNDVLKAGTVDAVVTADPFKVRILSSGVGVLVSNFLADLPEGQPSILYASTREWATKNPAAVKGFQAALAEAVTFIKADPNLGKTREHMSKYIKLPPEVMKAIQISEPSSVVTEAQLAWWIDVMQKQEMLQTKLEPAKLIVK